LQAQSRQVVSNQLQPHPRLPELVRRHFKTAHHNPIAGHNAAAFKQLLQALEQNPRPLVLDSFCGTGHSTAILAQRHPQHLVVGIDKSAQRLAKHPASPSANYLLLQADCEDIWQLLAESGLAVQYHYLLYPNPWPKGKHLQRRVHGNASFPLLLRLAAAGRAASRSDSASHGAVGHIEVRSNWQLYVEEFGLAMHLAGVRGSIARVTPDPPMTLFERKYHDSGQLLWRYTGGVRQGTTAGVTP